MADAAGALTAGAFPVIVGLLIGFVFGSVPFGYLLVRYRTGTDVRRSGSGNIGATNVGRLLGLGGGVLTLVLDAVKGALGVATAGYLGVATLTGPPATLAAAGALGAVLGHCYTPWLGGRGGKGVATLLGAFAVLAPVPTAIGAVALGLALALGRIMSLASLTGCTALVAAAWWRSEPAPTVVAAAGAVLVVLWRHRENIARIARGEETRLGGA